MKKKTSFREVRDIPLEPLVEEEMSNPDQSSYSEGGEEHTAFFKELFNTEIMGIRNDWSTVLKLQQD